MILNSVSFSQAEYYSKIHKEINDLKHKDSNESIDTVKIKSLFTIAKLYENIVLEYPNYNDSIDLYFEKCKQLAFNSNKKLLYAKLVLPYCFSFEIFNDRPNFGAIRNLKLAFEILKIYEQINDVNKTIEASEAIVFLFQSIGDYEKSIEYSKKILSLINKTTNNLNFIGALESIGDSYEAINKHDSSIVYYKRIYALIFSNNTKREGVTLEQKMRSLNNLSEVFNSIGKYNAAYLLYKNNENIIQLCNDTIEDELYELIRSGRIKSEIYQNLNNNKEAVSVLVQTLDTYKNGKDPYHRTFDEIAQIHLILGKLYIKYHLVNKAIVLLSKGIEYTRGYSDKAQILKSLSEAYYANGNIVKSFRIYKDYVNANDSAIITNNKELNTKYATKLSSEFEFKNQLEKEQLENQKQNAISNEKLKQQRLVITYSILVLLLIAFISIYIFRILLLTRKQKKTIEDQGLLVIEQKNIVEEKQKEIIDSISYAKRLQDAILPPREFVNKHLVENFIYYKPKDIVAGDFYWAEKAGEMFFIAAADSTGHGVPGAMVSVVCSNALNRAIKEFRLTETGKILDKTRELVLETFEKSASEVKDGMDISLLCIDSKNKNIFWSGANNPLWFIQDNELKEIKADKQPIGKTDYPKPFTTHQIEYKESTTFYLFTDGLADQFGGPNGKKFKYKQFSDLLIKNNNLSQKKQADIIHKAFSDWKGDLEQVDDVCVIGIKL